jgi:hypothetical protein
MQNCWLDGEDAYCLPQEVTEPKVVFTIRRKTIPNDDWMVVQAAMARLQRTLRGEGRESDDPLTVAKCNEIERQAVTKVITRIENVRTPGDCVERQEEILALLKEMDFGPYQTLVSHVIGSHHLTPIERKRSGSPSEGGQPSQTLSGSEPETSPTP